MPCPEFEKYGLLFVSGELESRGAKAFRTHLKQCPDCLQQVHEYRGIAEKTLLLASDEPSAAVRDRILTAARQQQAAGQKPESVIVRLTKQLRQTSSWMWAVPAAAAAVLLLVLVNPFSAGSGRQASDPALVWNDDFLAESVLLEEEMDMLAVLAEQPVIEEDHISLSYDISALNEDYLTIKNEIEDLLQNIHIF